jgi:amino acid permease
MNIWLVRLICAPLCAIFIILIAIGVESYEETENWILKILCAIGLLIVLAIWNGAEAGPRPRR